MRTVFCALMLAACTAVPAQAQTLTDAFKAAWQRAPAGMADAARQDEAIARRETARSWLRESPSIGAGYKTDQIDKNKGAREIELELGVPIALPGERRANMAVGEREADALGARRAADQLALAREVREAYWAARIAQLERELAQRRLDEATQLAADLAKRLRVGEAPRVDANQARSAQLAAEAALQTTQLEAQRALRVFTQLTDLPQLPPHGEDESTAAAPVAQHPALQLVRATAAAARARADQAAAVPRDTPEFTVTLTRDRGEFTESYGHAIRFGVKVPLGTDARNRVRIAQTGTERAEAEASVRLELKRLEAEHASARDELAAVRALQAAASERARLAADTQRLISRAYTLGERDLAQRLRADTERFEAELAAARAQAELGRAISRLNQALGLLP